MPRKRKTVKKSKRKENSVELALTIQKLNDYEPALVDMIREYTLHSKVVPGLLETARMYVDDLHHSVSPYANLHNREGLTEKMIAASDALAHAAVLSKPLIPGKVTALRRNVLPPGPTLIPKLTPRLNQAEYKRLWNEGRITMRSGPEGLYSTNALSYNPSPDVLPNYGMNIWPSNAMTPSNYELHKLKTALKILEEAREGFDPTPVVEELSDDEAGAARRYRRRTKHGAQTKRAHKKRRGRSRRK